MEKESMTTRSNIPSGQHEITQLQVLHVGGIPKFDLATWTYEVFGLVNKPFVLTWPEFRNLPEIETLSDFHCVTGWSRLDNRWGGVQFKKIYETAEPNDNAHYATIICDGGYTTSLPLQELLDNDVLFAYKLDGRELEPRFGGPLRIVVPKKYAYKSAKWVRKVKFTEQQELGYWELRGYSNTADPWTEDRYSS
jgi:DMSO/TMAO reductase YedYZ molybdopterin-dependent catalytic subunit